MQNKPELHSPAGKLVTVIGIAAVVGIAAISGLPAPGSRQATPSGPMAAETPQSDAMKAAEALKRANDAESNGDLREAFDWMRRAAELGNTVAQNNLGVMYQQGGIVPQDYSEAARWYRQSADNENPNAKANLAQLYARGLGLGADLDEAERLFREAAEAGVPSAENSLKMVQAKKDDNRNVLITLGVGAVLLGGMAILTAPGPSLEERSPRGGGANWSGPFVRPPTREDTSIGCSWGDRAHGTCLTP